MKRLFPFIGSIAISLVLIGAGCDPMTPENNTSTPTPTPPVSTPTPVTPTTSSGQTTSGTLPNPNTPSNNLILSAESLGNQMVKLTWQVNDAEVTDEGFMLVRDEAANPVHDGKNYWWRQHFRSREGTWISLPTGTLHFRVCNLKNAECIAYSNDVVIDVQ